MKRSVVIILFIFLAFPYSYGKKKIETGYLVCITGTGKTNCKQVLKLETAIEIVELHFPGSNIDFKKELKHSRYFQVLTENKGIYLEKKRISARGRYRRITDRQLKAINRQEEKEEFLSGKIKEQLYGEN